MSHASRVILQRWGISGRPSIQTLSKLLSAFADIPYENMTKIIRNDEPGDDRLRMPETLLGDFLRQGAGGTCFSLVKAFSHLATEVGFETRLVLADRSYGPNTHCAVVIRVNGKEYLADPGYLVYEPVELGAGATVVTEAGRIAFTPDGDGIVVHTIQPNGYRKFRYRLKMDPVDEGTFVDCWKRSFEWEMMGYVVLTKLVQGAHVYLRNNHLHIRRGERQEQRQITSTQVVELASKLGVDPQIPVRALAVLGKCRQVRPIR